SAEPASSGSPNRVHRHIVDGLAQGVGEAKVQSLFKAPAHGDKSAVIIGVSTGIKKEDLAELRIGPEVVCGKSHACNEARRATRDGELINPLGEIADTVEFEIVD